jgi:hypothetical protein
MKIVENYNKIKNYCLTLHISEVYINYLRRMAVSYNTFLRKNEDLYVENFEYEKKTN